MNDEQLNAAVAEKVQRRSAIREAISQALAEAEDAPGAISEEALVNYITSKVEQALSELAAKGVKTR